MGFFSRLFPPRADGKSISDEWTVLPEDNASELVLFGDDAATLMLQLDIDDAIASHQAWSQRLQDVLEGTPDAAMQPAMAHDDTCCHLGQWLHGAGRAPLEHYPAYHMLVRRHRYFHAQAAEMVALVQAGDLAQAAQVHKACRHAGSQITLLLHELQRGLGR